jgi:predicted amidophosphoribosyltransferase
MKVQWIKYETECQICGKKLLFESDCGEKIEKICWNCCEKLPDKFKKIKKENHHGSANAKGKD